MYVSFLLLPITAWIAYLLMQQRHQLSALSASVWRAEIRVEELATFERCVAQLESTQAVLESGIDETTSGVRALHHSIADIPFSVLEAIPVTRGTTKVVRGVHDLISDGVYASISLGNQLAGSASRSGIKASSNKPAEPEADDEKED